MTPPNNIIEDFRLCHGLLFDQSGLRFVHKCAVQANWSLEESPKTRPSVQFINTHRIQDTYTYANNLALDKEGTLFNPPKAFSRFKENNPLYERTLDKAVIFRIDKELWNINLAREDVKPTDEFVEAIKQAIEHNPTHRKLDDVFSEYGYWLNCKIKVGCRLQRFTQFYPFEPGQDHCPKDVESRQTEWIGGEGLGKFSIDLQTNSVPKLLNFRVFFSKMAKIFYMTKSATNGQREYIRLRAATYFQLTIP